MNNYFHHQLDRLQSSIVRMGELAGRQFGDAVAAMVAKDKVLAREVIERDETLDRLEDEHEEQTIQIIALNQPVARDLRLLVAFLHINAASERAGDLAVSIAESAIRLSDKPTLKPYVDIPQCYNVVRAMWDDALRCFSTLDDELAHSLRKRDDEVDRLNEQNILQLIRIGSEQPACIYQVTNILGVSKALERIADLSVDISDEVIYAQRGELRHAHARSSRNTA